MNSSIKQYLKEVSGNLACPRSVKTIFLQELKSEILSRQDGKDPFTLSELYHDFGTPDEIADGFFDRNDYDNLLKKAKRRTIISMCISIVTLILLICAIWLIVELLLTFGGTVTVSEPHIIQ
ncbi:MAG: DUF6120 family protein [Eubacteriales bacterium]